MKKVTNLISKEEYLEKIKEPIKSEVTKGVKKAEKLVSEKMKNIKSPWYVVTIIGLICIGITLDFLGAFIFLKGDNIPTGNIAGFAIMTLIGLGFLIAGIYLIKRKAKKLKEINQIYVDSMNKNKIFKISIEAFPDFEFKRTKKDTILPQLMQYSYGVPDEATIEENSLVFEVLYKKKYKFLFQSALFHWKKTSRDSNGNYSKQDHYASSGVAVLGTDTREKEFSFSLLENSMGLKKVEVENKKFRKTFHPRSNDKIKSRMMFTPLSMEEMLKHEEGIKTHFYIVKKNNNAIISFRAMEEQFDINAKVSLKLDKMIDAYTKDVCDDFYDLYEKIGLLIIPPFF